MLFLFVIPLIVGAATLAMGMTLATITKAYRSAVCLTLLGFILLVVGCAHGLIVYFLNLGAT